MSPAARACLIFSSFHCRNCNAFNCSRLALRLAISFRLASSRASKSGFGAVVSRSPGFPFWCPRPRARQAASAASASSHDCCSSFRIFSTRIISRLPNSSAIFLFAASLSSFSCKSGSGSPHIGPALPTLESGSGTAPEPVFFREPAGPGPPSVGTFVELTNASVGSFATFSSTTVRSFVRVASSSALNHAADD